MLYVGSAEKTRSRSKTVPTHRREGSGEVLLHQVAIDGLKAKPPSSDASSSSTAASKKVTSPTSPTARAVEGFIMKGSLALKTELRGSAEVEHMKLGGTRSGSGELRLSGDHQLSEEPELLEILGAELEREEVAALTASRSHEELQNALSAVGKDPAAPTQLKRPPDAASLASIELPRVPLPEGIAPSEASTVPDASMTPSNSINRELAGLVKRRRGRIQNESQENSWNDGNFKCMLGACTLCCCSLVLGLVIFGALAHGGSVCEDALACENLPPGVAAAPSPPPSRAGASSAAAPNFVVARGGRLWRGDAERRFMGANLWYAMNLGCEGAVGCDRARLDRELDRLKARGVSCVRILGASEGPDDEPWRVSPSLQPSAGVFNEQIAGGLDYTLAALERRGMDAIVTLNNMWPWSGGFGQYVRWAGGDAIPYPPPAEGGDWFVFETYASQFYTNANAIALADASVRYVVSRTSTVTGRPLSESPAILAWELANEPRGEGHYDEYHTWVQRTAALIKSLDPNHLVTIGSEGTTPHAHVGTDVVADHSLKDIDFLTFHIWPQNWGWFAPNPAAASEASLAAALRNTTAYIDEHIAIAEQVGKPLVLEEFGLARDAEEYSPGAADSERRQFYTAVFDAVVASASRPAGGICGVMWWAWAGEGRARQPGDHWAPGDDLLGDPPHEPQGWYSVFDADAQAGAAIASAAAQMRPARPEGTFY